MVVTSYQLEEAGNTVSFARYMVASDTFKTLFREGMDLVEEAAAYLDGPGRLEAKNLSRMEALAYASESMRLTTRLMQLASWLLVQRAVNNGEMSAAEAVSEKKKVVLTRQGLASNDEAFVGLPQRLQDLCLSSMRLQDRILPLDELLRNPVKSVESAAKISPVERSMEQLRRAFNIG